MLNENDVVEAVCHLIKKWHFKEIKAKRIDERGDDIVAKNNNIDLHIEAKGAGAARNNNYNQNFKRDQVKHHVAEAFYRAAKMQQKGDKKRKVGMAFPCNKHHNEMVKDISDSIERLKFSIFWVSEITKKVCRVKPNFIKKKRPK